MDKAIARYKLTDGKEADYGYGRRLGYVYESPSIWHGGGIEGYGTTEMYLPKEDVFVVIFSNCDCNLPKDISSRLAALAAGKPYEYKEMPLEKLSLQEYTGVYENQNGLQRIITSSENQLYSQQGRGPKSKLKAYQKDMFFIDAIVTLEFEKNKKGEIQKFNKQKLKWKRYLE